MSELVQRFDLPEPRDWSPKTLAWKLPGLLEKAGAKGDVLIVIDGLNRLRNDDGEVNLAWLPQVSSPTCGLWSLLLCPLAWNYQWHNPCSWMTTTSCWKVMPRNYVGIKDESSRS